MAVESIREYLFQIKKSSIKWLQKKQRELKRVLFIHQQLNANNYHQVPIIINNRNRLTFLKIMIEQLNKLNYHNIYILDNDSSYPPLLDYYQTVAAKVIFLKENLGYKALWESEVFNQFKNGYYVYSDPDISMNTACPEDVVLKLYKLLEKYPNKEKAGLALRIDDLPDHYAHKKTAIENEKSFWSKPLETDVYDAPVDTTFALYRPFAWGNAEECEALRLGGNYTASHLTWYINSAALSEEELYYKSSIKTNTSVYSIK